MHVLDGHTGQGRARLTAARIERLCSTDSGTVDVCGLDTRGYDIDGPVDLWGLTVPFPLAFTDCHFTDPLLLDGATLPALAILSSTIAGAHPTSASTSKRAAIWLCESDLASPRLPRPRPKAADSSLASWRTSPTTST